MHGGVLLLTRGEPIMNNDSDLICVICCELTILFFPKCRYEQYCPVQFRIDIVSKGNVEVIFQRNWVLVIL